jgi:hypothetical protein
VVEKEVKTEITWPRESLKTATKAAKSNSSKLQGQGDLLQQKAMAH